jgi:hypothetical protein
MPVMIVSVNGKRICSVKLSRENSRTLIVDWTGILGPSMHLGGPEKEKNAYWRMPKLQIGDEIKVSLVRKSKTDRPTNLKTLEEMLTPGERARMKKKTAKKKAHSRGAT